MDKHGSLGAKGKCRPASVGAPKWGIVGGRKGLPHEGV